jgi:hypothetical protein
MSQTINLSERLSTHDRRDDDFISFVLIHACVEYERAHKLKILDVIPDSKSVQVEFKVNGIEMDFIEIMERINSSADEHINKKAEQLVKDKFAATIDRIDSAAADAISKFRNDLGIPERHDD